MTPNNNLSILPIYESLDKQYHRKSYAFGEIFKLITHDRKILPFQYIRNTRGNQIEQVLLKDIDGNLIQDITSEILETDLEIKQYSSEGYDVLVYPGKLPMAINKPEGLQYIEIIESLNAYNPDYTEGDKKYNDADGTESGQVSSAISGKIPVLENTRYILSKTVDDWSGPIHFWDDEENWLGSTDTLGGVFSSTTLQWDFMTPVNCRYIGSWSNLIFQSVEEFSESINLELVDQDQIKLYSEVFCTSRRVDNYLKIEFNDIESLIFDDGRIDYTDNFKFIVYIDTELGRPDYEFEDEVQNRDGFDFIQKQISEKTFRFNFLAPEYLLDAMRLIRMSDVINITNNGDVHSADKFLITPKWEDGGYLASVEAEFQTNTVLKKIGKGVTPVDLGDFNNDYNNDYDITT